MRFKAKSLFVSPRDGSARSSAVLLARWTGKVIFALFASVTLFLCLTEEVRIASG